MVLSMVCIFILFFTCFIPLQSSLRSSHIAKIEDILCDFITDLCGNSIIDKNDSTETEKKTLPTPQP